MLLDIDLSTALERIGDARRVWNDRLVPAQVEVVVNSPYRPEYDWLFVYERQLASFLERWLKSLRHELIGETGILCEALANAYCHGHARDRQRPIHVQVHVGKQGLLISIADQGEGFNLRNLAAQYQRGTNYYHLAGNGLRGMIQSSHFGIFYTQAGRCFHLIYCFDGDPCAGSRPLIPVRDFPSDAAANASSPPQTDPQGVAYRQIAPPDFEWASAALLMKTNGDPRVAYGLDPRQWTSMVEILMQLVPAADGMATCLRAGKPDGLQIHWSTGSLLLKQMDNGRYWLAALIDKEGAASLSGIFLPKLLAYLKTADQK